MLKKLVILFVSFAIIASAVLYYRHAEQQKAAAKQKVVFAQNQPPMVAAPRTSPVTTTDLYQTFTLANGMKVIVVPNKTIPAVSQMVWYRVGAKDEVLGKSGLAHLQEHLMFKGTPAFPKGEFSRIVAENGGQENAFTGQDYTAYYQNVPKNELEKVMQMEADRMQNLTFNDAEFQTERKVVMEEFRMTMKNKPSALLRQELDAALYRNHPYRKQVIGWENELLALTRDDALAFHKKYYDPANAILVVAGDVDVQAVLPLAEKYYGAISSNFHDDRQPIFEPERVASAKIVYSDPRVAQPEFWQKFIAPSYTDSDKAQVKTAFALDVLGRLLGGGTSSILYKKIVVEEKLASAVGSGYNGYNAGSSEFQIFAYPQNGVTADVLQAAIEAEIAKVQAGDFSAERFAATKKAMIAEQIYDHEGLQQMAYQIALNYSIGLPPEFVNDWQKGVAAVTEGDVAAAAKAVLQSQKSVIGVLQPVVTAVETEAKVEPKAEVKTEAKVEEKPAPKKVAKPVAQTKRKPIKKLIKKPRPPRKEDDAHPQFKVGTGEKK